jgi:hypothetical protein
VTEVSVFLGGEGRNELGSWGGHPAYQDEGSPGAIETFLKRVRPGGWKVVGACQWCRIRKYRAKGPTPGEEQNVLGLAHDAKDAGAEVFAFVRDADDERERPRVIDAAVVRAQEVFPSIRIIGKAAIPALEGWILAVMGEPGTEDLGKAAAQKRLAAKGIAAKDTAAMVKMVERRDLGAIPADAQSLLGWLAQAAALLPTMLTE